MEKLRTVRIKTISQWHLLKQINCCLGKRRIPEEVLRKIHRILYSGELGRDGYVVLCLDELKDDFQGVEEAIGMYPNKIRVDERMDEIQARGKKGRVRNWYVTYAKMKQQKIELIYMAKNQDHWR